MKTVAPILALVLLILLVPGVFYLARSLCWLALGFVAGYCLAKNNKR